MDYRISSESSGGKIYFKVQFSAVTIQERLDFEGGLYREHMPSITTLFICTYNARVHTYIAILYHAARFQGCLLDEYATYGKIFKGGGISRCSEILRKYGI